MAQTLESKIASVQNGDVMLNVFLQNCSRMPRRVTRKLHDGIVLTPYHIVAHWMSTLRSTEGTEVPFILSLYDGKKQKALYLELFMDVPEDPWGTMASFTAEGDLRFEKATIYGESDWMPLLVPNAQVNSVFSQPYGIACSTIYILPPNWCTYVSRATDGGILMRPIGFGGESPCRGDVVVHVHKKHFPVLERLPYIAQEINGHIRKKRIV